MLNVPKTNKKKVWISTSSPGPSARGNLVPRALRGCSNIGNWSFLKTTVRRKKKGEKKKKKKVSNQALFSFVFSLSLLFSRSFLSSSSSLFLFLVFFSHSFFPFPLPIFSLHPLFSLFLRGSFRLVTSWKGTYWWVNVFLSSFVQPSLCSFTLSTICSRGSAISSGSEEGRKIKVPLHDKATCVTVITGMEMLHNFVIVASLCFFIRRSVYCFQILPQNPFKQGPEFSSGITPTAASATNWKKKKFSNSKVK